MDLWMDVLDKIRLKEMCILNFFEYFQTEIPKNKDKTRSNSKCIYHNMINSKRNPTAVKRFLQRLDAVYKGLQKYQNSVILN